MPREEIKESVSVSALQKERYVRVANFLNEVHAPLVSRSSGDKVEQFKVKWTVFSTGGHNELWASGKALKHISPRNPLYISGELVRESFKVFSSKAIKAGFNETVIEAFKANFKYQGAINTLRNDDFIKVLEELALKYEHKKQIYIATASAGLFAHKGVPTTVKGLVIGKFLTLYDSVQGALTNKDAAKAARVAASVFEDTQAQPSSLSSISPK